MSDEVICRLTRRQLMVSGGHVPRSFEGVLMTSSRAVRALGVASLVVSAVILLSHSSGAIAANVSSAPRYDYVFMLIEENHGYHDIIGNPAAPTINALARAYGVATQYYGITHPSGPNYVTMMGGGTFGRRLPQHTCSIGF